MANAIAFDTFKFINRLKEAGVSEKQAIAEAEALSEAIGSADVMTRKDLQIEMAPVKAELILLKWMVGLSIALSVSMIAMLLKLISTPAGH